jgi:signal recognition particle receptor subunit beta
MVQFNFSERTIKAKVVYYGPAQSGKTTNLEQVHVLTDPAGSNRLVSLNTAQDRTLFFDLLPFSLGTVSGYDFQVQLYTVPGQVQYNATRRVVLAGADAVVFVADSRKSMAKDNVAAFENMKVNLLANRLVPEKVPLVLQWNKRDMPDLQSEAELNKALNPWGRPTVGAVAYKGEGVMETFIAIVQQMLHAIAIKYNLKEKGLDPAAVPELVSSAFNELLQKAATEKPPAPPPPAAGAPPLPTPEPPQPAKIVLTQIPDASMGPAMGASSDTGLVAEELLARSIKSNVEMAEALSTIAKQMTQGLGTILSNAELLRVFREDQRDKRQEAVNLIYNEAQRLRRVVQEFGQASKAVQEQPQARSMPPASRTHTMTASKPPSLNKGLTSQPPTPPAAPNLDGTLQDVLAGAKSALDARGFKVELNVPAGLQLPRCPIDLVKKAVSALVLGVSATAAGGSGTLRCERKPVLLRGRNAEEIRREFLMVALAHGASLSPTDQQRVLSGADPGPLGEAWRLVREMGGFVRFAPLPSGLETRLFLPAQ